MKEGFIAIILVLLAFPVGYLLAYLARDELIAGKKYFKMVIVAGIVSIVCFIIFEIEDKLRNSLTLTVIFIIIVSLISLIKSKDKKFVKK